jgi:Ca2+-binding EF-hand superfamily protein
MLLPAIILSFLAAAAPAEPPINVVGHAWAPFISPMGEPFRAQSTGDDGLTRWFRQADRNQDGFLTPDEMKVDADRFFATLDSDHDGAIDPDELVAYEWEVAPEIQVNSKWRRSRGQAALEPRPVGERGNSARRRGGEMDDGSYDGIDDRPQGAARYALLNMPEPVAAADADFNRSISQAEFRQAATYRFQLLDSKRQGKLTLSELEGMVPPPPKLGKRTKRDKNAVDTRVGAPLPEAD